MLIQNPTPERKAISSILGIFNQSLQIELRGIRIDLKGITSLIHKELSLDMLKQLNNIADEVPLANIGLEVR